MIIILDTKDELFWYIEYYIGLQFLDHFFQIALILILFSHTHGKMFIVNMNQGQMTTVNKSQ